MKKIISLLSVILILAAIAVPAVSADDGYISHIVDEAGKLDSSDAAELENTYAGMYDEYGFDVVAMTIDGLPDDRSLMEYADDYYDYNGYSDDGCILVVNVPLRGYRLYRRPAQARPQGQRLPRGVQALL